jgi:hypothetical protein
MESFERREYICDKIIFITKFENLNIYFKISVVDGIFGWIFFMVYDIDIHQLNLRKFKDFGWNFIQFNFNFNFFHLCNNEGIIVFSF